jgi:hypothetical protein
MGRALILGHPVFGCLQNKFRNKPYVTCHVMSKSTEFQTFRCSVFLVAYICFNLNLENFAVIENIITEVRFNDKSFLF